MNNIKELQDKPENLKLLAAQRVAYARAKTIFGIQLIATVAFAVLFNFVRLTPKEKIAGCLPYIIVISVLVAIIDLFFFIKFISKMRTNAAKIQEMFDCAIYQLAWNSFNCGSKPDKNFIHENYKRYVADPDKPIQNWYDIPIEELPRENAILLCQETNLWYDSNLRDGFKKLALYALYGMIGLSILIGLITKLPLGLLILYVVAPLLPAIVLTIKIYQENEKSIGASEELKSQVASLQQVTSNPTIEQLRQIQDKIFCSRKDSSLVPEWFYLRKRPQLEEGMKINASK